MGLDFVNYVDEDLDQTHKSNFSLSHLIRHFKLMNLAYITSSLYATTD